MVQVPLAVEQNPAHQPVVPQVPGSLDHVALGKGMADVLARSLTSSAAKAGVRVRERALPPQIQQPKQGREKPDRQHHLPADRPNLSLANVSEQVVRRPRLAKHAASQHGGAKSNQQCSKRNDWPEQPAENGIPLHEANQAVVGGVVEVRTFHGRCGFANDALGVLCGACCREWETTFPPQRRAAGLFGRWSEDCCAPLREAAHNSSAASRNTRSPHRGRHTTARHGIRATRVPPRPRTPTRLTPELSLSGSGMISSGGGGSWPARRRRAGSQVTRHRSSPSRLARRATLTDRLDIFKSADRRLPQPPRVYARHAGRATWLARGCYQCRWFCGHVPLRRRRDRKEPHSGITSITQFDNLAIG